MTQLINKLMSDKICRTCLFTGLESLAGQSRVSDNQSAEKVIYKAFVVMEEIRSGFFALLAWRKGKVKTSKFFVLL